MGEWSTFVGNRVKEIRLYSKPTEWFHVPGELNAADLPSRGCTPEILLKNRWWEGPQWLHNGKDTWPRNEIIYTNCEDIKAEKETTVFVGLNKKQEDFCKGLNFFSKYSKIVRMIAWMLRFYKQCKNKDERITGELSYSEVEEAEMKLIRIVQNAAFVGKTEISNLQCFKDENNILRIRTKICLSEDPYDFKYPILLPCKHEIVFKLIEEQHRIFKHAGIQTLLQVLRERFWILKGRKTVRKILSKCIVCKRQVARSADVPFAPLPVHRFKTAAVFDITGIDLAGPLYLRGKEKAWIVLFTCSVYRAVHLELIKSLSTDAFIMALRRFIARRGRISVIYTDNGTNFVGTENRMKNLNWNKIVSYSTIQRIKWIFNPPSAPWWGGWWERLVRIIKELLRRNLGKALLNYEEVITILCDCESVINSRPLTYISDETDSLIPLTPANFLCEIQNYGTDDLDNIDRDNLLKRYKYLQQLRDKFRNRFKKEYLAELVQTGQRNITKIKVGDIVLVGVENAKRLNWPLGKVLEIYPGKDGKSRVARVKIASGEIVRPFQRLYPLEISSSEGDTETIRKTKTKDEKTKNSKVRNENKEDEVYRTKQGRIVKLPERFQF